MTAPRIVSPAEVDWLDRAYATTHPRFPIIGAVCSGLQQGFVWGAVNAQCPWVVVIHRSGFCQAFFRASPALHECGEVAELLQASAPQILPNYLMWYDPPAELVERLSRANYQNFRLRRRMRWQYRQTAQALPVPAILAQHPSNRCVALNADQVIQAGENGLVVPNRFWGSVDSFSANALAHGIVADGGQVHSICYAAAIHLAEAEVDVGTSADMSGQGLASLCTSAFISAATGKGISPFWDCFLDNDASMRLAKRLGFTPCGEYSFATFALPSRR
ncbi:MAG: GNAT family N-acetyltransferase [Betaproteobacteria bacterium]|nr:GNAT family N-acetyltransferase [Betaproteobacteria bacterium]